MMGRDRLVDQIAQAVDEKDKALDHLREIVHTAFDDLYGLRDNIQAAADWLDSLDEPSGVGSTRVVPSERADRLVCVHEWERTHDDHEACRLCHADQSVLVSDRPFISAEWRGVAGPVVTDEACPHCDGHGLMQTGYTGTLQYCGECNACGGSGTAPVVTEEMADSDAMTEHDEAFESWIEWRAARLLLDAHTGFSPWRKTKQEALADLQTWYPRDGADGSEMVIEQSTVIRSRPVRVEEQGEGRGS